MRYADGVIPPDLWTRLRALDHRCDLELLRLNTAEGGHGHTSRRNYTRMWRVVIRDRFGEEGRAITSEAPRLVDVRACAVVTAERQGPASRRQTVSVPYDRTPSEAKPNGVLAL